MKKIIFLSITLSIFFSGCATYTPVHIEPFTKSFEVQGDKNKLYVRANNWMVENFTNAKSVIQFSDKEEGIVTGKYLLKDLFDVNGYSNGGIFAIIKIQVKDDASKITIIPDDFQTVQSSLVDPSYAYTKEKATEQINLLVDSYENYLKTDTSTDW